ncbi:MAG: serine hydrolase domain-containing protein [Nocardioides sp.]
MSLQARLASLQAHGRLPSIVGGVLRGHELVESAAVNGTVETAYRIGSITKTFVAVLVMQLRDEGQLDLDDPLGRYLPESGYGAATIGELLSHASGMQSEPVGPWWERTTGGDLATLIAGNDGGGAVAGAGEYFHYSNLGYALLGEVVARLRGAPWWDGVADRLLEPLSMTRTSYGPVAPHAWGYSVEHATGLLVREPHADTGAMAPAGQAWSTVADLATWATVLAGRRPDVLAPSTASEMHRGGVDPGYGLGLRHVQVGNLDLVGHSGSMPGFLASLFVDPHTGDGTVALANATTGMASEAVPEALLGDPPVSASEWVPTQRVPDQVAELLGFWFWGNTALDLRWHNETLQLWRVQTGTLSDVFEIRDGAVVGVSGYHRGETLKAFQHHLECATFVYTRTPYDPRAPIPGGVTATD